MGIKTRTKVNQHGFTLIELIIVIVIIAILAAFAIPRFVSLAGNARTSTISGVAGSISSAHAMAHGLALALGQGTSSSDISVEGKTIKMQNGYPSGIGIVTMLADTTGYTVTGQSAGGVTIQRADATTPSQCQVVYTSSTDGITPPSVVPTTTGCG